MSKKMRKDTTLANQAPAGVLSAQGIAEKLGFDVSTIRRAIVRLAERGVNLNSQTYRFRRTYAVGYDKTAQEQIAKQLRHGLYVAKTPEGVLSMNAMANKMRISLGHVTNAVYALKAAGVDLKGEVYLFGGVRTAGYGPEAQKLIRAACHKQPKSPLWKTGIDCRKKPCESLA